MESLSLSPSHITLSLTARYQGKFISKRSDFISLNWCKINEKILLKQKMVFWRPRCVPCPASWSLGRIVGEVATVRAFTGLGCSVGEH